MKRVVTAGLVVWMVFMMAGQATAEYKARIMLAGTVTMEHPVMIAARNFADLIKERSNGRIEITLHPDYDKGERKMAVYLQEGRIDMTIISTGPLGDFSPSISILDFPFMFRDFNHVDQVMDGPIGNNLLKDLDKANITGLAFWESGFRHLTNSKRPIKNVEDAKGLSIRTMENKVHMASWKAAGLDPTPISYSELYRALQQNIVDCQENPVATFYNTKFWETGQKHFSLTSHIYSPAPILMNKKLFDAMPEKDQEMFRNTAREVARFQRKIARDAEAAKLQEIEAKGVVVVRDVNRESFKKAMSPVYGEFGAQFPKAEIDAIMNVK